MCGDKRNYTLQANDPHAVMACQIVGLPALAGKEQDLPLLAKLCQIVQRLVQALVVEGQQGIVQDQRGILLCRQHHLADSKPCGQIQLIGGAA